jgi:hypothetical protein
MSRTPFLFLSRPLKGFPPVSLIVRTGAVAGNRLGQLGAVAGIGAIQLLVFEAH